MTEDKLKKPSGPSARTAVLAGAGVVFIFVLAVFIAVVVGPLLHTHEVLQEYREKYRAAHPTGIVLPGGMPTLKPDEDRPSQEAVERLGGPERAKRRLLLYLRLPERFTPRKREAVRCLGFCGARAVPALVRTLGDEEADLWDEAAEALARIGPEAEEAVPALVRVLEDPNFHSRQNVVRALGCIGARPEEVAPVLACELGRATGGFFGERELVCQALRRMGRPGALALIDSFSFGRPHLDTYEIAEELARMGPEVVPPLVLALAASYEQRPRAGVVFPMREKGAREGPLFALRRIDAKAMPSHIKILGDPRGASFRHPEAARFLPRRLPEVLEALKRADAESRLGAIWELGPHVDAPGSEQAVPALGRALDEKGDSKLRFWAAWTLGSIGERARPAVPALEKTLKDEDEDVRRAAAAALEAIRGGP